MNATPRIAEWLDPRLEPSEIRGAGLTRTSQSRRIRAFGERRRGRASPRVGEVASGTCLGVSCRAPDRSRSRRPKNRSDRSPAHSTVQLRLEDCPNAALGGAARYAIRHSDHSSQRQQQRAFVPCYRAGWKCSFLILITNHRSSFVAFGRSAVFVPWHLDRRDKGTSSWATGPEEAMLACFTVAPRHMVVALHGGKGRRARCGCSSPPAYLIHTMCVHKERPRPLVNVAQPHGWETRSVGGGTHR